MANDAGRESLRARRIWRITLSGIFITVVVVISAMLLSRRSKPVSRPPVSSTPPVVAPSKPQPTLQKYTVFFFDPDALTLVGEARELPLSQQITDRLEQVITELIGQSRTGLQKTIPTGTSLYGVYIDDQSTAYLDFSSHLKDRHIGGTTAELLTVKTVLRTVEANFPNRIKAVQILIEGLEVDSIVGHVDISKPLSLSPEPGQSEGSPVDSPGDL